MKRDMGKVRRVVGAGPLVLATDADAKDLGCAEPVLMVGSVNPLLLPLSKLVRLVAEMGGPEARQNESAALAVANAALQGKYEVLDDAVRQLAQAVVTEQGNADEAERQLGLAKEEAAILKAALQEANQALAESESRLIDANVKATNALEELARVRERVRVAAVSRVDASIERSRIARELAGAGAHDGIVDTMERYGIHSKIDGVRIYHDEGARL